MDRVNKYLMLMLWPLALILGGWTLSQLPLTAIAQTITALDWAQWLAWLILNLVIILLATQRWWVLIAACKQPLHKALLSLGLDRFYELWINFSVLLICVGLLLLSPATEVAGWLTAITLLPAFLIALSLLGWLMLRQPQWISRRLHNVTRRWQEHPRLHRFENQWQALRADLRHVFTAEKKRLLLAVILSIAGWAGLLGELLLLLHFVNVQVDLAGFILIIVAMRLALLLPVPGGIGTLEASVLWSFQALNLPASAAMGLIVLMRLRDVVVLVAGLACLRVLQFKMMANKTPSALLKNSVDMPPSN
jgi:uncharacterized protein (TIRG00374 family)